MQKSIFAKYFTFCATMVIGSVVVLGMVFLIFISQYFKNEKYDELYANSSRVAAAIAVSYEGGENAINPKQIGYLIEAIGENSGSVFFMTDNSGRTILCTEKYPCSHTAGLISQSVIDSVAANGLYSEIGNLGGVYSQKFYTVGVPVILSDGTGVGFVFSSAQVAMRQNEFINEMIKIFLISAVAVLIITFVAVYFITLRMVRPLRQMSEAAKRFGSGDFSSRLEVTDCDEVGQLAMALNNMAQSLSVSESSRRSFVANISHELKTPMTSISGFIDGILDGTIPPDREKYYLNIVSDETKRLSRLVRTMLNLSRIEAGELKINLSEINIVDTICRTVFSFEQQIDKKNLTILGLDHEKVIINADPDLIHQVVYNLTENAVKFVNEGGYIEFNITEDAQNTTIAIKNSGEGLSKEELPKIFDRFYKTDKSRGLDKNGVGLGLYIVKSIVSLHGGSVIVRSVKGEYSEFVFTVPKPKQKLKKNSQ